MKGSWKKTSDDSWEYQTEDGEVHGLVENNTKHRDKPNFKSSDSHTAHVQGHLTLAGAQDTVEANLRELLDATESLRD